MNIQKIKSAIGLLNSMVAGKENHILRSESLVSEALEEIKKYEECKVRWFKVCNDGSISYQTTPHGYGPKILCKIVPIEKSDKFCPNCGHSLNEQEVT